MAPRPSGGRSASSSRRPRSTGAQSSTGQPNPAATAATSGAWGVPKSSLEGGLEHRGRLEEREDPAAAVVGHHHGRAASQPTARTSADTSWRKARSPTRATVGLRRGQGHARGRWRPPRRCRWRPGWPPPGERRAGRGERLEVPDGHGRRHHQGRLRPAGRPRRTGGGPAPARSAPRRRGRRVRAQHGADDRPGRRSAAAHASDQPRWVAPSHRRPARRPSAIAAARQKSVGSARTKIGGLPLGVPPSPPRVDHDGGDPSARAAETRTVDHLGRPRLAQAEDDFGPWPAANALGAEDAVGGRHHPGPSHPQPERGSASTGQPRAADRASTAAGSPQPAPATITPRRSGVGQPRSADRPATGGPADRARRPPGATGAPPGRPGTSAAGRRDRRAAARGRAGSDGPDRDRPGRTPPRPRPRAASDRHDVRGGGRRAPPDRRTTAPTGRRDGPGRWSGGRRRRAARAVGRRCRR